MGGKLEKSEIWGIFDIENGGRFVFELLWGFFSGKSWSKLGKTRNYPEKVGKSWIKSCVLWGENSMFSMVL